MRVVVAVVVMICLTTTRSTAQDTGRAGAGASHPDTTHHDSLPPVPTPAQLRYTRGFSRAARGVSQIKVGIELFNRAQSSPDSAQRHNAGRVLGGYCGTGAQFLRGGRAQTLPTAYDPPIRTAAKDLIQKIDTVIAYTPTCERQAMKAPVPVVTELVRRLRLYEGAVAAFRTALSPPQLPPPSPLQH